MYVYGSVENTKSLNVHTHEISLLAVFPQQICTCVNISHINATIATLENYVLLLYVAFKCAWKNVKNLFLRSQTKMAKRKNIVKVE